MFFQNFSDKEIRQRLFLSEIGTRSCIYDESEGPDITAAGVRHG